MKKDDKFLNFVSKIEQNLLDNSAESIVISNQSEKSFIGGKGRNRHCSNTDEKCDKSKNRSCSNYNSSGCIDSVNRGSCSSTKSS